jgi:hypothetical protein
MVNTQTLLQAVSVGSIGHFWQEVVPQIGVTYLHTIKGIH